MDEYNTGGYKNYIWKYFRLHANQRVTLFRFYVIFFSLFGYAIAHLIIAHSPPKMIDFVTMMILGVLFICVTFIFWRLDIRNKYLIHNAEDFFVKYENKFNSKDSSPFRIDSANAVQVFTREKDESKCGKPFWRHSRCFAAIFFLGLMLGLIVIAYALLMLMGVIPQSWFK